MWEKNKFTKHGKITITDELLDIVTAHDWSNPHLWNPYQSSFKGTQCIYYNFSEISGELYKRDYTDQDLKLRSATQYILDYILTIWPNYRFVKGEISHCPPGEKQGFHVDPRVFHRFSHRVHVPITTNPQCSLKIINEKQHLAQGEIWTFNNVISHASENLGTTSRVHIVVDIMKQETFDKILLKYSEPYLYEETNRLVLTI
jgi:hypothetical protein